MRFACSICAHRPAVRLASFCPCLLFQLTLLLCARSHSFRLVDAPHCRRHHAPLGIKLAVGQLVEPEPGIRPVTSPPVVQAVIADKRADLSRERVDNQYPVTRLR